MKYILVILTLAVFSSHVLSAEIPVQNVFYKGNIAYDGRTGERINGRIVHRNSSGIIIGLFSHKNGILDGSSEIFYENGRISLRANYKTGFLDGFQEFIGRDGKPYKTLNYKDGKFISCNGPLKTPWVWMYCN